jgi:hypothetical protein
MTRSEMIAFAVQYLATQLSRARILVNGEMCARCERYGPETCARCWEEKAWAETDRERRHREEADGRQHC